MSTVMVDVSQREDMLGWAGRFSIFGNTRNWRKEDILVEGIAVAAGGGRWGDGEE